MEIILSDEIKTNCIRLQARRLGGIAPGVYSRPQDRLGPPDGDSWAQEGDIRAALAFG